MSQTLAIFVDQYRALKARKMFWIVLGISVLVVAAFAAVGIDGRGLTLLGYSTNIGTTSTQQTTEAEFYKGLFSTLLVDWWLAWLAALLALISTAGIFPTFISSGAIDLTLSKPIGRVRLFLTQYAAGLLFVTLQVGVFCVASFFVLGFRAGVWEGWLFLAIPLVVCFFSFLFCVCVLFGVLTRSTVAAILLTLLFWFALYIVNVADAGLIMGKTQTRYESARVTWQLEAVRRQMRISAGQAQTQPAADGAVASTGADQGGQRHKRLSEEERQLQERLDSLAIRAASLEAWSNGIYTAKTFLPKTGETTALLQRVMSEKTGAAQAQSPRAEAPRAESAHAGGPERQAPTQGTDAGYNQDAAAHPGQDMAQDTAREISSRSVTWVLGTSLLFEAAVLALACFIFCRRDY